MKKDIQEKLIIPETPKVIPNEQLMVYIPVATVDNPGIASYDSTHFEVIDGKVMLKIAAIGDNCSIILGKMEDVEGVKCFYELKEGSNSFSDVALFPVLGKVYYDVLSNIFYNYTGREYSVLIDFNESGGTDEELAAQVETNRQGIETLQIEKVGKTQYASDSVAGIIKYKTSFGTYVDPDTGILSLVNASEGNILAKQSSYQIISPKRLDYAVKVGVTTNTTTLGDGEKTSACDWLGALQKVETTISTPAKLRVYAIKHDGSQTIEDASYTPGGYAMARYDGGGRLSTLTPTSDNHCINKKYVDDSIANVNMQNAKMYLHKITINNSDSYPWGDVYFNIITSYPNAYTNDTFFTEKVYKAMLGTPYVAYASYDGSVGSGGAKTYTSGTFYKGENAYFAQGTMMVIDMLSYTNGTSILVIDGNHTLADEVIEL